MHHATDADYALAKCLGTKKVSCLCPTVIDGSLAELRQATRSLDLDGPRRDGLGQGLSPRDRLRTRAEKVRHHGPEKKNVPVRPANVVSARSAAQPYGVRGFVDSGVKTVGSSGRHSGNILTNSLARSYHNTFAATVSSIVRTWLTKR